MTSSEAARDYCPERAPCTFEATCANRTDCGDLLSEDERLNVAQFEARMPIELHARSAPFGKQSSHEERTDVYVGRRI